MKYASHVTPSCLLLSPTLWKPSSSILSPVIGFFDGLFTWIRVCFASNRHPNRYHVNMFLFMCGSRGRHLVINLSYHNRISSILSPFSCSTTYSSWFATSYCCPSFTVSMWSYHWQSKYPFALVSLQKWTYNNPGCISRYYCNYCFKKWNTCSKGGLSHFPHHTQWGVNILITRDNFQTFMDVIVDPIHIDIMWWTLMMTTHVTMITIQENKWSYIKRTSSDALFPLLLIYAMTYSPYYWTIGAFILVLIHFLPLIHRSLSCGI